MSARDSRILMPQRVLYYCLWFVSGVVACGSLLDAFSKASILPLRLIVVTTLGVVLVWVTLECLMRFGYIKWKTTDGKVVIHRRLGWALRLPLLGAIALLWFPILIDTANPQAIATQDAAKLDAIRSILMGQVDTAGKNIPAMANIPGLPQVTPGPSVTAVGPSPESNTWDETIQAFKRLTEKQSPSALTRLDEALVHFSEGNFSKAAVAAEEAAVWVTKTPGRSESAMEASIRRRTEIDAWKVAAVSYAMDGNITKAVETSSKWLGSLDLDKDSDENMAAILFRLAVLAANNQQEELSTLYYGQFERMRRQFAQQGALDLEALRVEFEKWATAISKGDPVCDADRYPRIKQWLDRTNGIFSSLGIREATVTRTYLLSFVLGINGYFDESIVYLDSEVVRGEKTYGEVSGFVGDQLDLVAGLKLARGRVKDAVADYRRALAIRKSIEGDQSKKVGKTLKGLANALEKSGETAEANECRRLGGEILGDTSAEEEIEAHVQAAMEKLRTVRPDGDPLGNGMEKDGVKLMREGKADEAEVLFWLALKRYEFLANNKGDVHRARMNIAAAHVAKGEAERARGELEILLIEIGPLSEQNALLHGRGNYHLARCYILQEQPKGAVPFLRQSLVAYRLIADVPPNFIEETRKALEKIEGVGVLDYDKP